MLFNAISYQMVLYSRFTGVNTSQLIQSLEHSGTLILVLLISVLRSYPLGNEWLYRAILFGLPTTWHL